MPLEPLSSKYRVVTNFASFDLFWLIVSPFLALWLREPSLLDVGNSFIFLSPVYVFAILTVITSIPIFIFFRIQESLTHLFSARDAIGVLSASFVSVLASVFVVFSFSRLDGIPRPVPIIYGLILIVGLMSYRLLSRKIHEYKSTIPNQINEISDTNNIRRILIVGLDHFAISTIRLIDHQRPRTVQVVAAFSLLGKYAGRTISGVRIIDSLNDMGAVIDEYKIHGITIDEVWISDSSDFFNVTIFTFINNVCLRRNIVTKKLSEALNPTKASSFPERTSIEQPKYSRPDNSYFVIKRTLDIIVAVILGFLLMPVFFIVVFLNLMLLGPPILFWQERLGKNGIPFRLYKVRTLGMPLDVGGKIIPDHHRLSPLGVFFRRFRLDEIPQLLSIVVGEMSGIGPRPLLIKDQPKNKRVRLLLRPGLSGWAQVNGGELLDPEEKNALDCYYVYNASLKLDVLIVFKTIDVLVRGVKRNESAISEAKAWMKSQTYFY